MATKKERRSFIESVELLTRVAFSKKLGESLTEDEARSELLRTLRRIEADLVVKTLNRHAEDEDEEIDRSFVKELKAEVAAKAAAAATESDDDEDDNDDEE